MLLGIDIADSLFFCTLKADSLLKLADAVFSGLNVVVQAHGDKQIVGVEKQYHHQKHRGSHPVFQSLNLQYLLYIHKLLSLIY